MSIAKISVLVGTAIVTVGGSAAVATRDKWWPRSETAMSNMQTEKNGSTTEHNSTGPEVGTASGSDQSCTGGKEKCSAGESTCNPSSGDQSSCPPGNVGQG